MADTTAAKTPFPSHIRRNLMIFGGIGLAIIVLGVVGAYFLVSSERVSIDTASISAPLIPLAPTTAGRLNAVYVNEGDTLLAGAPVALVGTEVVKTKIAGLIVQVTNMVGAQINPGTAVVTMIDPSQLRVVGKINENQGLSQIAVGDPIVFTVDAFGGRQFNAVVDEVSPTSNQSDVVFNVSNNRQEQTFSVKGRFDIAAYSELKNGMSARMWVYQTQ